MFEGKRLLTAMGMAWLLLSALLHGGEADAYPHDGLVSIRKNAVVSLGGELRVDYSYRTVNSGGAHPFNAKMADLMIRQANLRIRADVHPNVSALFKLNLASSKERFGDEDEVFEEAMLVMRSVAGTGLGFFAGKGRAPYGQDITLGMLQSYHHAANHIDSSEGRVFIIDPPADHHPDPNGPDAGEALPPMRPGQFDRVFMAGVSYEWDTRWRVEVAAFQPNRDEYRPRLNNTVANGEHRRSDVGLAGRVWWSPVEDLVVEASGMLAHSREMGVSGRRFDLRPGDRAVDVAGAVSLGFDWRRGPWRLFGEYQHAWNWNFSKGYDTDIWQLGLAREIGSRWRLGAMLEHLRIDDAKRLRSVDDYYKLALNVKYSFNSGLFVLAEYGHEWFRRDVSGALTDKRRGNFWGMRLGFSF